MSILLVRSKCMDSGRQQESLPLGSGAELRMLQALGKWLLEEQRAAYNTGREAVSSERDNKNVLTKYPV